MGVGVDVDVFVAVGDGVGVGVGVWVGVTVGGAGGVLVLIASTTAATAGVLFTSDGKLLIGSVWIALFSVQADRMKRHVKTDPPALWPGVVKTL